MMKRVLLFLWLPLCLHAQTISAIDRVIEKVDKRIHIGVKVVSVDRGITLYSHNADHLFVPSSNTKLFTAGAALFLLGPYYTFETRFLTHGDIEKGILKGDLYLQGDGDPSFSIDDLETMIQDLCNAHVKKIDGDLVIDNFAFDAIPLGPGWMWDDDNSPCYSRVNALSIHHNCVDICVVPSKELATPPHVTIFPKTDQVTLENRAATDRTAATIDVARSLNSHKNHIQITGKIAHDSAERSFQFPLKKPHLFVASILQNALNKAGISWTGSVRIAKTPSKAEIIATHTSKPLAELIQPVLKESDNFYSDMLFKKMGQHTTGEPGSWKNGAQAVRRHLERDAGLTVQDIRLLDGCGLSRYNLASPHQITKYLLWIACKHPYSANYLSALPIGARDGSLKNRYAKDLPILRAKTGGMTGITSLCGYIKTKQGETLAFAIMISGFTDKISKYRKEVEDAICIHLGSI